ncbi:MAG: DUF2079 domain-containing protein [Thermoplasmata archaeon]|nr:DUF2079 domain-containing protein [Thermoplasmata archaeon]
MPPGADPPPSSAGVGRSETPWTPPAPEAPSVGIAARTRGLKDRVGELFEALGFHRPGRWFLFLCLAIAVDAIFIAWLQVAAYNAFYTFSQDYGSFNQSFYTAAFKSQLFYYTSNLPAGTHGTFFAVHFSPFLFVILPFYALFASPPTLLVIKAIALSLGALPVYGLAHRRLGSPKWALAFGVIYLISPITMDLDWTSFDSEVFLPVLFLTAFYFLTRRRYLPFIVSWVLALSVIETTAPLLLTFAALAFLGSLLAPGLLSRAERMKERRVLAFSVLLALFWIGLSFEAIRSLNPNGSTYGVAYGSHYTVLGASSFQDVVPQAVLHPDLAGAALSYQGTNKIAYVLLLFGSLAFLPLFGELRYLMPVGAWLVLSLLSNVNSLYAFGSAYLAYVSPFLFAGAIGGVVYLRPRVSRWLAHAPVAESPVGVRRRLSARVPPDTTLIPGILVVAVVISVGVGNPLLQSPAASLPSIHFGFPVENAHAQFLTRVLGLIPSGAGVLTTAHLFPQVSERMNAFVLPSQEFFAGNNTYWGYLNQFINESAYVLLDFTIDSYVSQLMQYFGNYSQFGVLVGANGVLLLERGWTGGPLPDYWPGTTVTSSVTGATVAATPVTELRLPSSSLFFANHGRANVPIWNGPGIPRIGPGQYQITVFYQLSGASSGQLFKLQVTETPLTVATTTYLNSSFGHHFSYTVQKAGPAQMIGQTVVSGPVSGSGPQEELSITVNVSDLANLATLGTAIGGTFSLQVSQVIISMVAPPTTFPGG